MATRTSSPRVPGFRFAGGAFGIKKNGKPDLALFVADAPATAAALFTRNRVCAAPVVLSRARLRGARPVRAIVANAGCANACTGELGLEAARRTTELTAAALGGAGRGPADARDVLVASTGVIGAHLPLEPIARGLGELARDLRPDGLADAAAAIMTTDTFPKLASATGTVGGAKVTVAGIAKGAGMIRPDMATMLAFLFTDAVATPAQLRAALRGAADDTFNALTVDGDTSTNDTVFLLASGAAGNKRLSAADAKALEALVREVSEQLARSIARDGEGATKCVEVVVSGARRVSDARAAAQRIANSPLVKTALYAQDANWGRILAAVGATRVPMKVDALTLDFDGVRMVERGAGLGAKAEARVSKVLKRPGYTIEVGLGVGSARARVFTCDLSVDYVKINANYRS